MGKRRWIITGIVTLIAAAWLTDAFWFEPESTTVTTLDVQVPSWPAATPPLKVALLSDFHVGGWHMPPKRVLTIARQTTGLHPDLILLAGDYIGGDGLRRGDERLRKNRADQAIEDAGLKALNAFDAPLGVYAIMGNHDCYWDCAHVRQILADTRVHLLENSSVKAGSVWIEGIEDGQTQHPDFDATEAEVPKGAASLVLTHNPGLFDWQTNHASLQLSGHTHGGQVRFPIIGAPVRMSRHTEDTAKGWTIINNRILIVTHGLGESGLPLRFDAPPQIMVLTIHPGPVAKVEKLSEVYLK